MGHGHLAADLAALLENRDILRAEGRAPDADIQLRVEALQAARRGRGRKVSTIRGHDVRSGTLEQVLRQADHWRKADPHTSPPSGPSAAVGLLLALAYPDRLGRRRQGERGRFLLRNGRGAYFHDDQSLGAQEWLVVTDVDDRGSEARIFMAAGIEQEQVEDTFGHQVEEVEETVWDPHALRVQARKQRRLGSLILSQTRIDHPEPEALAVALMEGLKEVGLDALSWTKEAKQLRQRIAFLHLLDPQEWPDASEDALLEGLGTWLQPFVGGLNSLEDLRRVDLTQALMTWVGWDRREVMDQLAPSHLPVPSGSRIRIDYSDPEAPALAVRLQEVFGMTRTPRLGGGRVPVTMRLLSPAQRPVQVTRDLASFWKDTYHEVRKEMRGRYPKHYWPEDPYQAEPTRRTKPR